MATGRAAAEFLQERSRQGVSLADHVLFLSRSLRRPQSIGAIAPSSRWLARALAREARRQPDGPVVELGAGTGAVTQALLAAGIAPRRLVVVERDRQLHALLSERFRDVMVLRADARRLQGALARQGLGRVTTVVSSLPLMSMPLGTRLEILEQSFAVLGPGGAFIQYTYGPTSPLPRDLLAAREIAAEKAGFVARNLPPATIWRYQRETVRTNLPWRAGAVAEAHAGAD